MELDLDSLSLSLLPRIIHEVAGHILNMEEMPRSRGCQFHSFIFAMLAAAAGKINRRLVPHRNF